MKKPYLPPRIEFEEIEADEREMLLDGSDTSGGGSNENKGDETPSVPGGEGEFEGQSLDLDFVMNT